MNINEAFNSLRSVFIEWEGFLVNNRYLKVGSTISWEQYAPKKFNGTITAFDIFEQIETAQYSFQVASDGSIFQIYYQYDNRRRKIKEASLGFLMSGVEIVREDLEEIQVQSSPNAPVGWLRVDYSDNAQNDGGLSHPKCHLHVGLLQNARIPVDRIPNPKQFVDFVIASCYPEAYCVKRLDNVGRYADINHMCQINNPLADDINMNDICEYAFHLRIPFRLAAPQPVNAQQIRRR